MGLIVADQDAADLVAIPQGGGAVKGLGETFQPDLHTGTGSYTVPIQLPPGRCGMQPKLSLTYNSGFANGPFGFGWSLPMPRISRQTNKRVPRFTDDDVFVLSGAEELVPVPGGGPGVQRFRPRTEGLFARIERQHAAGQDYWVVWCKDGTVSRYGSIRPPDAGANWTDAWTIAQPDTPRNIYSWLLEETVDATGNIISYGYRDDRGSAQRYLGSVRYADYGQLADPRWLVEVRLAYEARPDTFVDRGAGFALSTGLRCSAIEVWVDTGTPVKTRTIDLTYADTLGSSPANGASLLSRIVITGHSGTQHQQQAPLTLEYSHWEPERRRWLEVTAPGGALPAVPLTGPGLDLVDLFGNGLPCIVELAETARFWRNLGDGRFDWPQPMRFVPAGGSLLDGSVLADLDGDGRPDLLVNNGGRSGYYPIGSDGAVDPHGFVSYRTVPSFALSDPQLRLIDLDGDNVVDAMRTGATTDLYYNRPGQGWVLGSSRPAGSGSPPLTFDDKRVKLADMTGDGRSDIVLITGRRISYWPNLGLGRWGGRVDMADSPLLDDTGSGSNHLDERRVLVGDVDGDGCADIVLVGRFGTTVWVNRAGAGFAPPVVVPGTPPVTNESDVRLVDLLGCGTSGILWSSPARQGGSNYRFLDLAGGIKPYLLTGIDSHTGSRIGVEYCASTTYAVRDAAAGRPWRTTLPFPVQVVSSLTTSEHFSGSTLSSQLTYHEGHWDGAEREFRGFARVDRRDVSEIGAAHTSTPPVETRTWFHVGPVGPAAGGWHALDPAPDQWGEDPSTLSTVDLIGFSSAVPRRTLRDATRTLGGRVLRTEMYGQDGSRSAGRPYTVTEHSYRVVPVLDGRPADDPEWARRPVVFIQDAAERSSRWDRGTEPLTTWRLTDQYDEYGRPSRTIQLAVPRQRDPSVASPGSPPFLATLTTTGYASRDDVDRYMADRVAWRRRDELHDSGDTTLRAFIAGIRDGSGTRTIRELDVRHYDGQPFVGLAPGQLGDQGALVLTEQLAFTDALVDTVWSNITDLPPGYLVDQAAAWPADYPAEFRAGQRLGAGYSRHEVDDVYAAGYYVESRSVELDTHSDTAGRGLVVRRRDSLGHMTAITYDAYQLLPTSVTDEAGLTRTASYDYAHQHPKQVTDVNDNRTQAGYSPLGLLAWVANLGAVDHDEGDTAEQPAAEYDYQLTAWDTSPVGDRQPASVSIIKRVQHRWDLVRQENERRAHQSLPPLDTTSTDALFPADELDLFPERFLREEQYFDGLGRALQSRSRTEDFRILDIGLPADPALNPEPITFAKADGHVTPVAVSGWREYDDKGQVISEWETFHDSGWAYRAPTDDRLEQLARTDTTYDARGAVVRVRAPDGSERGTVYGRPISLADPDDAEANPWDIFHYDANDNAGRTHPTSAAGWAEHWNTPTSVELDALGRSVRTTARTAAEAFTTLNQYDIDGNVLSTTDPLGRVTQHAVYDLLGRVWRSDRLDSGTVRLVLDAQNGVLEQHDANGATRLALFDSRHRPTRLWARDRTGAPLTLREVTLAGDDPASGLSRAQAAGRNLLGRTYRCFDEAGLVSCERYDLLGHLVETTRQVVSTRVLLQALPTGPQPWTGTALSIQWEPPEGQNLTQHAATLLDPTVHRTSTGFDAAGRRTVLTCPMDADGHRSVLTANYTRSGQVTELTLDDIPILQRAAYDTHARPVFSLYGNGLMTRRVYDPQTGCLARVRTERAQLSAPLSWTGAEAAQAAQNDAFSYDLVGNLLGISTLRAGCGVAPTPDALDRCFAYDPLYRLTAASGREHDLPMPEPWSINPGGQDVTAVRAYSESYVYDAVGNLTAAAHQAPRGSFDSHYTLAADSDRLATFVRLGTTYGYTYDAGGNLSSETSSRLLEADHAGRLSTFRVQAGSEPSKYAQYRYDPAGQRVLKLVRLQGGAARVTLYLIPEFERLILDAHDPNIESHHDTVTVLDGDARVAVHRAGEPVPGDPLPMLCYELTDQVGSIVATLDGAGTLLSQEEYTPFGELAFGSHSRKRYRFTAKERDEESGFYAIGARYYASWLARWTSCDSAPGVDVGTPYSYCSNRPLHLLDKTGASGVGPLALPPVAPPANGPPVAELLREIAGEGLGDGIPRGALRLVPQTGPGAATSAGAAEVAVLGGAILAATGSLLLLGMTLHDAVAGRETPIDVADKFYGTHFGDVAGWVTGTYSRNILTVAAANRDDGAARKAFRSYVTSTILAGCKGAEHPLRKLLDPSGKPYPAGDRYNFKDPIFDAGHPLSIAGGGEGLGIEWPAENRYDGSKSESQGVILEKIFVEVCGVPIEAGFLRTAEEHGLVRRGTLENASRSGGWVRGKGLIAPVSSLPATNPPVNASGGM